MSLLLQSCNCKLIRSPRLVFVYMCLCLSVSVWESRILLAYCIFFISVPRLLLVHCTAVCWQPDTLMTWCRLLLYSVRGVSVWSEFVEFLRLKLTKTGDICCENQLFVLRRLVQQEVIEASHLRWELHQMLLRKPIALFGTLSLDT